MATPSPSAGPLRMPPALTERERDLLLLVAQGWDNARIAARLCLTRQTIRNYTSRLYAKLSANNRAEAIV
ncbi:MAG: response regulator transcription factor [Anaerolineae bacterium]